MKLLPDEIRSEGEVRSNGNRNEQGNQSEVPSSPLSPIQLVVVLSVVSTLGHFAGFVNAPELKPFSGKTPFE